MTDLFNADIMAEVDRRMTEDFAKGHTRFYYASPAAPAHLQACNCKDIQGQHPKHECDERRYWMKEDSGWQDAEKEQGA